MFSVTFEFAEMMKLGLILANVKLRIQYSEKKDI